MSALLTRPASAPSRAPRGDRVRARAELSLPVALVVAAASGLVLSFAYPGAGIWVLAFPGVAGALVALRGRGFRSGVLVGLVFGVVFWFSLVDWVTLFLGPVPLLALGTLEALLVALGSGLIAVLYRSTARLWPSAGGRVVLTPLLVAATWTAREVVAGTWPYGGFDWGAVALSQSQSPFAYLSAWFGTTGLSFVLVWLTALGVALATEPRALGVLRLQAALPRVLAMAVVTGALLAIPTFPITVTGSMRVAAVQPNSHAGYFDPKYDPAANLEQTVRATSPALGKEVDLVVWPEGAAMYDPITDRGLQQQLEYVTQAVGAPLLTGAITERGGRTYNSSLLWSNGGIAELYDKVRPVPFGEYVPDRAFWTPFAPDLLKLIGRDYTPGTRSSVMQVGRARVGVNICFDIVDDGLILGSVQQGAQLLIAQTNNADFGDTDENEQQLAIARLRAIETGRALMSDSTVASTTAIGPDGRTLAAAKPFTTQTLVVDLPLASGITPAVAFGVPLGATIALLGGVLPVLLAVLARRPRRRAPDARG
ncbi:apolipoprotein N-acyltransferase [Amnibacterium kyonggiense]|uniref:Apolipoprotein N-acyltransferase n=1 Tax=Amnibacterium kyonggiense TaxID=595671 RepID=A0A4R7FKZ7_9MICO|nr:apolipoprotein N-acyltransferase [Amnibacterium kyonggiense]TDS77071.1 apolipoprotein N-acyltransferase [Amnibacterium kyonggiense]